MILKLNQPSGFLPGLDWLAIVYFSPILLIHNPFVDISPTIKFPLMVAITSIAVILLLVKSLKVKLNRSIAPWIASVGIVYLLAIFRYWDVYNAEGETETTNLILQALLSLVYIVIGYIVLPASRLLFSLQSVAIITVPVSIYIIVFHGHVFGNWPSTYRFGDFNYYSYQQIGFLFGISLITFVYWASIGDIKSKLIAGFLFLLIAYYSFQNPARGELIIGVVAVGLMVAPKLTVIALPLLFIGLRWLAFNVDNLLFARFKVLFENEGWGSRDQFFVKAFEYLNDDLIRYFIGGGIGSFQNYFDLPIGSHPHNLYLEALTTGGVLLLLAFFVITTIPVLKGFIALLLGRLNSYERFVFAICFFVLLLQLKSGTLNASWRFFIFLPFFVYLRNVSSWTKSPNRQQLAYKVS